MVYATARWTDRKDDDIDFVVYLLARPLKDKGRRRGINMGTAHIGCSSLEIQELRRCTCGRWRLMDGLAKQGGIVGGKKTVVWVEKRDAAREDRSPDQKEGVTDKRRGQRQSDVKEKGGEEIDEKE